VTAGYVSAAALALAWQQVCGYQDLADEQPLGARRPPA